MPLQPDSSAPLYSGLKNHSQNGVFDSRSYQLVVEGITPPIRVRDKPISNPLNLIEFITRSDLYKMALPFSTPISFEYDGTFVGMANMFPETPNLEKQTLVAVLYEERTFAKNTSMIYCTLFDMKKDDGIHYGLRDTKFDLIRDASLHQEEPLEPLTSVKKEISKKIQQTIDHIVELQRSGAIHEDSWKV